MAPTRAIKAADAGVPGSPAWWESRPQPPSGPRRGRPPRSFERIVAAAADLVDEAGPRAFSMRLLAERLDTSTATLYRHVNGKDELMVHVVDRMFSEIEAGSQADETVRWQEGAIQLAVRFHRTLGEHPNLVPLLVNQVPVGPHALAVRESMIGLLIGFGFAPRLAARAFTAIAHYVIGFAAQQQTGDRAGPQNAAALRAHYRALDPDAYPSIAAAADDLAAVSPETEFLEELQFMIDGIDRARSRVDERSLEV